MNIQDENAEDALYNQWSNFASSGQWERAKGALGELLVLDPDSAWTHCKMGYALYHLNDHKQSELHFKKATALEPDNADAFQGLTYLYLAMGRAGTADDHCRKALQLDPDDIENWFLMARLCIHYEDPKQANYCLDRAAELNPNSTRLISMRTQVGSIQKGKEKLSPRQQIAGYEEVLRKNPESEFAHYQIGAIKLDELRDYRGAEESFREALRLNPQDKDNQKALMSAIRKRDPVLKLLWSPFSFGMWVFDFYVKCWDLKWPIIFLIFTWQFFIVGGLALWFIFFTLFWPVAKVYEWLTLVEAHKKMGLISIHKGPFAKIHRLSFPARFSIFLLLFASFWTTVYFSWQRSGTRSAIIEWSVLIITGGVFLLLVGGLLLLVRDGIRDRLRRRKNKNLTSTTSNQ